MLPGWGAWAALAFSVATDAVSTALHQPFHAGGLRLRFFDLRIDHLGASRLTHGVPLYATPMLDHLGFTYPPFAGLLLAPLGWASLSVDAFVMTGLNILLLVWVMRRTLMFTARRQAAGGQARVLPSRSGGVVRSGRPGRGRSLAGVARSPSIDALLGALHAEAASLGEPMALS